MLTHMDGYTCTHLGTYMHIHLGTYMHTHMGNSVKMQAEARNNLDLTHGSLCSPPLTILLTNSKIPMLTSIINECVGVKSQSLYVTEGWAFLPFPIFLRQAPLPFHPCSMKGDYCFWLPLLWGSGSGIGPEMAWGAEPQSLQKWPSP